MRLTLVHVSALLPRCAQIGILANKGISATDIKKLRDAGLHTVADIQHTTTKKMLNIKGLSEAKVQKIKDVAKNESGNTFMSGSELRQKRESILKARRARARCCRRLLPLPPAAAAGSRHCCSYYNRCSVLTQPTHASAWLQISTGSSDLNALLGGGIETGCITEVFGEFRTGKSQLSHTLAVTTQLCPEDGGANGKVLVIDTEGAFRPDRLEPIAERYNLEGSAVLDNVTYVRAYTSEHQTELLKEAAGLLVEDSYRCLIIDSATSLFRVDYTGRGELAARQRKSLRKS